MSLVFASLCPHPPLLIPEVGGESLKRVTKTKKAMEELAERISEAAPSTIIVISPHGLVYPNQMNINGMPKLYGDFGSFGAQEVSFHFENNLGLAGHIDESANKSDVPTLLYDNGQDFFELDHGTLVPLFYLTHKLRQDVKIVPVAYSYLPVAQHFVFGQVIADVIKKSEEKIAVVASGDMSHRLLHSQYGYSKTGPQFDNEIQKLIIDKKTEDILNLDEEYLEEAGECGYRSLVILLGILDKTSYAPQVLSYEGPFGVGYLVVDFQLKI